MAVAFDAVWLVHAGGVAALSGLSCLLPAGQFCAVLGPSGAGKSSFLRIAGGMTAPTAGTIAIDGRRLLYPPPRAISRRIGHVHQDFALVAEARAAENIIAGAAAAMPPWRVLTGLYPRWARQRATSLHLALGLDPGHLELRLGALSGGQQQRVGIARALMMEPALVLADEPVASVDPATAVRVLTVLRQWCDRAGATILCALHQPELACSFADRILVLDAGRLVFDGTPACYRIRAAGQKAA
jgi:phosphonate transport system ATP-binding protein